MVALISFIEGLQGFVFLSRTKRDKPIFVRRWWFLMWLHSNYLNEISRITRFREDTPKCLYQLSSTIKLLLISPQFFLSVLRYTSSSYHICHITLTQEDFILQFGFLQRHSNTRGLNQCLPPSPGKGGGNIFPKYSVSGTLRKTQKS